jgi:transcriptional regulator with XRE-family HTH domain
MLTEELLGQRVRAARIAAGLKQEELAQHIGVDQPTISRFEKGRDIGSILLTKIAEATGKDLQFFVRPEFTPSGVLFKRGSATLENLNEYERRMLEIVEDYEFLRSLE